MDELLTVLRAFVLDGDWAKWDWLAGAPAMLREGLRQAAAAGADALPQLDECAQLVTDSRLRQPLARYHREEFPGVRVDCAALAGNVGRLVHAAAAAAARSSPMPELLRRVSAACLVEPGWPAALEPPPDAGSPLERLTNVLDRLQRAGWRTAGARAYIRGWLGLRREPGVGSVSVPILAHSYAGSFIVTAHLTRRADPVPELYWHPDTALCPLGVDFGACLFDAWRRCPLATEVRLAYPPEATRLVPLDGDSAGAVLATAQRLLADGLPFDPDLAISAKLTADALAPVGHELAKARCAAAAGLSRLGLAPGHGVAEAEVDRLAVTGLRITELPNLDAAVRSASTLARSVHDYLAGVEGAPDRRDPAAWWAGGRSVGELWVEPRLLLELDGPAGTQAGPPSWATLGWRSLPDWLRSEQRRWLCLMGAPGSGRSSIVTMVAAHLAKAGREALAARQTVFARLTLPIVLRAPELLADSAPLGVSCDDWVRQRLADCLRADGHSARVAAHLAAEAHDERCWLFLDDWEAVTASPRARRLLELLRGWRCRVVLVCGDGMVEPPAEARRVRVEPLDPARVEQLARAAGGRFWPATSATPLATLIAAAANDGTDGGDLGLGAVARARFEALFRLRGDAPDRGTAWLPAAAELAWRSLFRADGGDRLPSDWLQSTLAAIRDRLPLPAGVTIRQVEALPTLQLVAGLTDELLETNLLRRCAGRPDWLEYGDDELRGWLAGVHAAELALSGDPTLLDHVVERLCDPPWPTVLAGAAHHLARHGRAADVLAPATARVLADQDRFQARLGPLLRALAEAPAMIPAGGQDVARRAVEVWLDARQLGIHPAFEALAAALPAAAVIDPNLIDEVAARLESTAPEAREAAAALFGELPGTVLPPTITAVLGALRHDPEQAVRRAAAAALERQRRAQTASTEPWETALAALGSSSWEAREQAAEALEEVLERTTPLELVAGLVDLLGRTSWPVAEAAAQLLGLLPAGLLGTKVAEIAAGWLREPGDLERRTAALALLAATSVDTLPAGLTDRVLALVDEASASIRAAALDVLAAWCWSENLAIDRALAHLDDDRGPVRRAAAGYLAAIDAGARMTEIEQRARYLVAGESIDDRRCAARLCGSRRLDPQAASRILEILLGDGAAAVRLEAVEALARWPGHAVGDALLSRLVSLFEQQTVVEPWAALGCLTAAGPRAAEMLAGRLAELLASPHARVREVAAASIAALGPAALPSAGLELLERLLGDESRQVRGAAARAVRRCLARPG